MHAFDACIVPGVNYVEVCVPNVVDECVFATLLQRVKGHHESLPLSQKYFKEYMFRNLALQINDKYDAKVYKLDCKRKETCPNGVIAVSFNREKASFHTFPSMSHAHSVAYVNAVVFKFHNRVFLNFEEKKHEDGAVTRRVYINYNHDDNVDIPSISRRVRHAMDIIMHRQP